MQKLRESIAINAPREKVWDIMLNEPTYSEWTKPFSEGGRFEGSWEEGSEIRFIGPDPNTGEEGGMIARVRESRRPEFISLEHFGILKNGKVDTTSEEVKKWTPAFENYTFNQYDGVTEVIVEVDTADEYREMFEDMWPKALQKLKEICER